MESTYCITAFKFIHFFGNDKKNVRDAKLDGKDIAEVSTTQGYVRSALLVTCATEEGAVTRIQQPETYKMVKKAFETEKELLGMIVQVPVTPYPLANGNMASSVRVLVKSLTEVDDQLALRGMKRPVTAIAANRPLVTEG